MITQCLKSISDLYDHVDALIITNKEGIVEYSVMYCEELDSFENEGYTGMHILDIYPSLSEETSSHFRVMKNGIPIIGEKQKLTDLNGKSSFFVNSTFPIEYNHEVIGAIEASILCSTDGKPLYRTPYNRKNPTDTFYTLDDIITANPIMVEIKDKINRISSGDSPVLLSGETGTGKELVAQAIHSHSSRAKEVFVSLNCSAIPSTLLESTLFGTVKGSFTGAEDRKGLFELAHNGTLFLDELSSMDVWVQAKLLKVIEEKKIRRVGGEREIAINVRIISAMNEDPFKAIEGGTIRSDLYYRLGVIQINLLPLRERKEDILLLADSFIRMYNVKMNKKIKGLNDITKNVFTEYNWPGNIRELRNAIEYAFNLSRGEAITIKDIPEHILFNNHSKEQYFAKELAPSKTLFGLVEEYEREIIRNTLRQSKHIADAAKKLGITRQALQYKIDKYRL
ncbi:sigma-54-dependent Fis family transcriptional regulator [uncultured Brevibacillus sp.]|uniref:sigma-54 interaction domain-containing protein n=1 Tax=uncultured Brevibacillus sp. TaxID=169970 RepID=UPI002596F829|nr:sigma 54-interacting transcriptional regulator [uncultured Brevibacillus sp.]